MISRDILRYPMISRLRYPVISCDILRYLTKKAWSRLTLNPEVSSRPSVAGCSGLSPEDVTAAEGGSRALGAPQGSGLEALSVVQSIAGLEKPSAREIRPAFLGRRGEKLGPPLKPISLRLVSLS